MGGFFDAKDQQANYFAMKAEQEAQKIKKEAPKVQESAVKNNVISQKPKSIKLSYKEPVSYTHLITRIAKPCSPSSSVK